MHIHPRLDRVLIKPAEPPATSKGGIVIPESVKRELHEVVSGRVIAAGPGGRTPDGVTIPMPISAGNTVLFEKYAGHELTVDGEKLVMVRESDILALVTEV